jgi:hypothetical protein
MWNPAVIGFALLICFAFVGALSTGKPKKEEPLVTPKEHQRPRKTNQQARPACHHPLRRAAKRLISV